MPSLKDTKRRIVSVKNTQKITRAMKLVSSAKYARANHAVLNSKPYNEAFTQMLSQIAQLCKDESEYFEMREEKSCLIFVVSTDRGLCGGLNSNIIKKCNSLIKEKTESGVSVDLVQWGKKADSVTKGESEVIQRELKVLEKPSFSFASKHVSLVSKGFLNKKYDRVYVLYSKFVNAMSQVPTLETVLPCGLEEQSNKESTQGSSSDMILEPNRQELLKDLIERHIAVKLYSVLLENSASEHAARMTAMDNATNNADKVIKDLTLEYNRARQAAITKELIEITSGAEAL